jgi:hypothetical protein
MTSSLRAVATFGVSLFAAAGMAGAAAAASLPGGWTGVGGFGAGSPNGVVTAPPAFGPDYAYVTTTGGLTGVGSLGLGAETNGSTLSTSSFNAAVGDKLSFYFNYVTSDGAGFADYAFVDLVGASSTLTLFTARTIPSGDTVPGFGLPGLSPGVTLTPGTTPIIGGGPAWNELGGWSGSCWDVGCGYTGWVKMDYTIETAGVYTLTFAVTNWSDARYDSGLAIAGATINDRPITDVPAPAALALFGLGLVGLGAAARRRQQG